MNRRTMIRNHPPLLAALLALAACQQSAPAQPPLAGAAIGEEFTLTGETGEDVSWSDFDGQYRTLYFGYTYCPDVCPVDTQRAMAGLKAFEQANPELGAQIQERPGAISVRPGLRPERFLSNWKLPRSAKKALTAISGRGVAFAGRRYSVASPGC